MSARVEMPRFMRVADVIVMSGPMLAAVAERSLVRSANDDGVALATIDCVVAQISDVRP